MAESFACESTKKADAGRYGDSRQRGVIPPDFVLRIPDRNRILVSGEKADRVRTVKCRSSAIKIEVPSDNSAAAGTTLEKSRILHALTHTKYPGRYVLLFTQLMKMNFGVIFPSEKISGVSKLGTTRIEFGILTRVSVNVRGIQQSNV